MSLRNRKLVDIVKRDKSLTEEDRMEFMSLAEMFIEDFSENMYKTSIQLNDEHPFGMDVWQRFIMHPSVRKYIDGFKHEEITQRVDAALSKGDKNAIQIKKELERMGGTSDFHNFVIFRLPEKTDMYEYSSELIEEYND